MLNPSRADGEVDDHTIRKCIRFSMMWGYDALTVVNLFALRSRNPRAILSHKDPIGQENDWWINTMISRADRIVAAWGSFVPFGRADWFRQKYGHREVYCLDLSQTKGEPLHPLYQPYSRTLIPLLGCNG
jgi:hypothetical protein